MQNITVFIIANSGFPKYVFSDTEGQGQPPSVTEGQGQPPSVTEGHGQPPSAN